MANEPSKKGVSYMEDYVSKAERVMKGVTKDRLITTSKIRDLLAQVNELYNDIILEKEETLNDDYVEKIRHLRVKMVYDAGRDKQMFDWKAKKTNLTEFYDRTGLLDMVKSIGNSRKKFLDYCRYFEALVAYHKFYGGADK